MIISTKTINKKEQADERKQELLSSVFYSIHEFQKYIDSLPEDLVDNRDEQVVTSLKNAKNDLCDFYSI